MAARGSEGGEAAAQGKEGLHRLFRYADGADAPRMPAGAAGASASGAAQPLMNLVFGEVVDAFGSGSRDDVLHRVSKARLSPTPSQPQLEFRCCF